MAAENLDIELTDAEAIELDRLAEHFTAGDRAEFFRLALVVMASKERVERLSRIADEGREQIRQKHGRDLTPEELENLVRAVGKNKAI